MTNKRRIDMMIYALADFLTALVAWACFFLYRKWVVEKQVWDFSALDNPKFLYGIILIPIGWVLFYAIFDKYRDIYRLARVDTFTRTFLLNFMGVLFLFFTLILDDFVTEYHTYYKSFIVLFLLQFFLTVTVRLVLLTRANRRIKANIVSFNTIIVGGNQNALELYEDIMGRDKSLGYKFLGFIDSNGNSNNVLAKHLPKLGKIEDIANIIREHKIEDVIIAIETSEHNRSKQILDILFGISFVRASNFQFFYIRMTFPQIQEQV